MNANLTFHFLIRVQSRSFAAKFCWGPFKWTTTWLDGRSTTELSELKPNVQIDAGKFAKPAAPK